ncbi:somatic embryogenesis receptor kinase 1-like [Syzygium oleosum]|uniref:somatic embryogenesis receptor kinase 1-like n=1 Tax=Syzygium oleosum TaxID=219896 RepID=UPI0011D19DCA|nr:somatic embryogenesis receptor kinase 1-like [Syzygium oleosum]
MDLGLILLQVDYNDRQHRMGGPEQMITGERHGNSKFSLIKVVNSIRKQIWYYLDIVTELYHLLLSSDCKFNGLSNFCYLVVDILRKPFKKRKVRRERREYLLVYPLAVNGNLASHLRERPALQPPLNWPTRMHIALGVARGLSYLHEGCSLQIIHCDIKPSNILLDENFKPLIADFGLAKFMIHEDWNQQLQKLKSAGAPHQMAETEAVNNHERSFWALERSAELCSTFRLCGTYGYMPPEYVMRGELSAKNDVFAFGMVLLELVSGFKVLDLLSDRARKGINEFEWVKYRLEHNELGGLIDPSLRGDYDENEAKKLVKLALFCIQSPPTKRPTMSEVVRILKGSCLDERWESEKEGLAVDIRQTSSQPCGTVTDSASHLDPEELSGPRCCLCPASEQT